MEVRKDACAGGAIGPPARKLKEQAAARGRLTRELILSGIEKVLLRSQRPRPGRVEFPLIRSKGVKVNLTNERIYELVPFP